MATLKNLLPVEVEYDIEADDLFAALNSFSAKTALELADRILSRYTENPHITPAGRSAVKALITKHLTRIDSKDAL